MVDVPVFNKMVEKYLTTVNYPYAGFGSTVMVYLARLPALVLS